MGSGFAFLKDYNYFLLTKLDIMDVMCHVFLPFLCFSSITDSTTTFEMYVQTYCYNLNC